MAIKTRPRRTPQLKHKLVMSQGANADSGNADCVYDIEAIVQLLQDGDSDIYEELAEIMRCDYNRELASALLDFDDEALAIKAADWTRNQCSPNVKIAKKMLSSPIAKIRVIASSWVLVMFSFNDNLLQFMFKSKYQDVIKTAKKWFMSEKDHLGFYVIKKQEDGINILYEGSKIDVADFPEEIINALSGLAINMDIEAQKVYLKPDLGWQLIVHNVSKISGNSLRHALVDINERGAMLVVVADALGWDSIDQTIVSNDVFQQYLVTSV